MPTFVCSGSPATVPAMLAGTKSRLIVASCDGALTAAAAACNNTTTPRHRAAEPGRGGAVGRPPRRGAPYRRAGRQRRNTSPRRTRLYERDSPRPAAAADRPWGPPKYRYRRRHSTCPARRPRYVTNRLMSHPAAAKGQSKRFSSVRFVCTRRTTGPTDFGAVRPITRPFIRYTWPSRFNIIIIIIQ